MKRALVLLVTALLAGPAFGQTGRAAMDVTRETVNVDGSSFSYAAFPAPAGCASGYVPYFDASLKLQCSPTVYAPSTDTTTVGTLAARNVTAIPLPASGSVTVTPVLSKIGAITVVAGSLLADGDALSVGDGVGVVPIEFDASPGDGTTGGAVPIIFDGTETATQIRDAVKAILDASGRDWTTSNQGADGIGLVRATPGATGGAITESVTDAGFTVTDWTNPTAATTYTYSLQACLADGTCNAAGPASTTAAGVATLSAANPNRLTWSAVPGAASYKIRRDVGGASTGVIWSGTALTVDDTGLAGDSSAKPTVDGTGVVTAAKFVGPGLGITNAAGANVLPKSDGTNLVASALSENGNTFSLGVQAGTNVAGTSKTIVGNLGTGNATSGALIFQTGVPQASGAAQHVAATALTLTNAGTGGTSAPQALFPDGTAAVPSFAWAGDSDSGMYRFNNSRTAFVGNGNKIFGVGAGEFHIDRTTVPSGIGFSQNLFSFSADAFFSSPAAATLQLGAAASATPVAQTLQSQGSRGGTDSNVSGSDFTVSAGLGTGNVSGTAAGRRGDLRLRTQATGSSGTTQATGVDRLVLAGQRVTLTESSATPVLDVSIPSDTIGGGTLWYTIRADDATDFQAIRGRVQFAAVNKGGTLTVTLGTPEETTAVSAGTLTNTATLTTGTNSISLNLNAVSSLTQTTLVAYVSVQLDGTGNATTK